MLSIRFSFSKKIIIKKKNGKQNTVHLVFHFHEGIENELLKNIKINVMVIFTSIIYMLFKSKFVSSPRTFSVVQLSRGHEKSAVYIRFILIVNCDIQY